MMAPSAKSGARQGGRRRRRVLAVAAVAAALSLGVGPCSIDPADEVEQPIRFNHKLHIAQDLECTSCHEGAESQPHATLPTVDKCMECHSDALSKSPEETKVRVFAAAAIDIPWIRVNRLPGHVYFSHRAHVKWARLECASCHGDMKTRETPVTASQIESLSMQRCVGCHRERGARTDCLTCHK